MFEVAMVPFSRPSWILTATRKYHLALNGLVQWRRHRATSSLWVSYIAHTLLCPLHLLAIRAKPRCMAQIPSLLPQYLLRRTSKYSINLPSIPSTWA
jgi:hypothetical protein